MRTNASYSSGFWINQIRKASSFSTASYYLLGTMPLRPKTSAESVP
jgi:hypothetical protein